MRSLKDSAANPVRKPAGNSSEECPQAEAGLSRTDRHSQGSESENRLQVHRRHAAESGRLIVVALTLLVVSCFVLSVFIWWKLLW